MPRSRVPEEAAAVLAEVVGETEGRDAEARTPARGSRRSPPDSVVKPATGSEAESGNSPQGRTATVRFEVLVFPAFSVAFTVITARACWPGFKSLRKRLCSAAEQ